MSVTARSRTRTASHRTVCSSAFVGAVSAGETQPWWQSTVCCSSAVDAFDEVTTSQPSLLRRCDSARDALLLVLYHAASIWCNVAGTNTTVKSTVTRRASNKA